MSVCWDALTHTHTRSHVCVDDEILQQIWMTETTASLGSCRSAVFISSKPKQKSWNKVFNSLKRPSAFWFNILHFVEDCCLQPNLYNRGKKKCFSTFWILPSSATSGAGVNLPGNVESLLYNCNKMKFFNLFFRFVRFLCFLTQEMGDTFGLFCPQKSPCSGGTGLSEDSGTWLYFITMDSQAMDRQTVYSQPSTEVRGLTDQVSTRRRSPSGSLKSVLQSSKSI